MVIIWRRIDHPGREWFQLQRTKDKRILEGIALLSYDHKPCYMEYVVECDLSWETRKVSIIGQIGKKAVSLSLKVNVKRQWLMDGKLIPSVAGCVDVDLGFSPSTNLLPIKRLNLGIGEHSEVTAAWVHFPSLRIKPLEQFYMRSSENVYHYESAGGRFKRDLVVNKEGFITKYPDYWELESTV